MSAEVGPTEAERLADVLYRDRQTRTVPDTVPEALDARAILASDWLAERDARIKADAIAQERAAWVAKASSLLARFTHSESCSAHHPDDRVADEDCDCWRRALLSSDAEQVRA